MVTPLLATKLYVPWPRAGHPASSLVTRCRLNRRLEAGLRGKLTLISAPAGFGKTSLIVDWLQSRGQIPDAGVPNAARGLPAEPTTIDVGWLSLDEGDNDPARFLSYLIAALQPFRPQLAEPYAALLHSPQPPAPETILAMLLNALAAGDRDLLLVLDDYHVIDAQAVHALLALFLERMPPQCHLLLATRSDPPLPLARLRSQGQMVELRTDNLRFTHDETATFLNAVMGLDVTPADLAVLEARTEGWITGLQLAALSLQGRADASQFVSAFGSAHRYIMEYLVEEVLDRQPVPIRRFLLYTAILNRLSGPLCDALLEEVRMQTAQAEEALTAGGQAILDHLERANLFLIPLDEEGRWYRYHHLFGAVLAAQLQRIYPDRVAWLHRRASDWFEQQQLFDEAIHHALAAGEFERTVTLLERLAPTLLKRGEMVTLRRQIERLPSTVRQRYPQLGLALAEALAIADDKREAEKVLDDAEGAAEVLQHDPAARALLLGKAATIRLYLALLTNDREKATAMAERALRLLPAEDLPSRAKASLYWGLALFTWGRMDEAIDAFGETHRLSLETDDLHTTVWALDNIGDSYLYSGRLHQAEAPLRRALQLAAAYGQERLPTLGLPLVSLSMVLYEWNRLDEAAVLSQEALSLLDRFPSIHFEIFCRLQQGRVAFGTGNLAAAEAAVQRAAELAEREEIVPLYASQIAHVQMRLWLALGRRQEAKAWGRQWRANLDDALDFAYEPAHLALARLLIFQNQHEEALRLLRRLQQAAAHGGRRGILVESLLLQALAQHACGQHGPALAIVQRALVLGEPEGFVRIFVDEGPPLAGLLSALQRSGRDSPYVAALLAAFPHQDETSPMPAAALAAVDAPQPQLVEPLSPREMQTLRLVAAGLSNRQIATELVITVGTVKRHLNNIYGKLGVGSRTQALARAAELGLL
jgi:LuxR family transcriptional regulator, maltose regulon positive regulatory protein